MEVKGILDRIEDDKYAVILAEEIGKEFVLNIISISIDIEIGDALILSDKNGEIIKVFKDNNKSMSDSVRIKDKMKKTKSKHNKSEFKRS